LSLITQVIFNLKQIGFYDFFLPFLLILAVTYGILQEKKIISSETSVNGVISLAIAFLATYFLRGVFYTKVFGMFGMVLSIILIGLIFLTMLGINISSEEKLKPIFGVAIAIICVLIAIASFGSSISIDSSTILTIVVLIFTFSVVLMLIK